MMLLQVNIYVQRHSEGIWYQFILLMDTVISVSHYRTPVFFFFLLCFFFLTIPQHVGILVPDQGSNLCPLQQKCKVLTTEPPETPQTPVLNSICNNDLKQQSVDCQHSDSPSTVPASTCGRKALVINHDVFPSSPDLASDCHYRSPKFALEMQSLCQPNSGRIRPPNGNTTKMS